MQTLKSQNAIEFMASYSFALLVLTIVIAVLFLYLSIPKTIVPFQCTFNNGFSCSDVSLFAVAGKQGEELVVVADDTQPGIINVSKFGAVLNTQGESGSCVPQAVSDGQYIYCVVDFTFQSYLTNVYYGTFNISANYCTNSTSLSTATCAAGSEYLYDGSFRIQPSLIDNTLPLNSIINSSPNTRFYVPIYINNTQPVSAPAPFQQEIQFAPDNALLAPYESADLGNMRFYYGNKELTSWCELNCASDEANNAIFWVRLPFGVQPYANSIIDMEFLSASTEYDGIYAGEAPNQSATYGEYDNGQEVFDFYDDFAGTSLSSKWTAYNAFDASWTIDNGITLISPGMDTNDNATLEANSNFSSTSTDFIIETAMNFFDSSAGAGGNYGTDQCLDPLGNLGVADGISGCEGVNTYGYVSDYHPVICSPLMDCKYGIWFHSWDSGDQVEMADSADANQYNILDQQTFLTDGYFEWTALNYPAYTIIATANTTLGATGNIRPYYWVQGGYFGQSAMSIEFVRVRAYPPAGIMPEASLSLSTSNVLRMT